jgi:hypothetical protein
MSCILEKNKTGTGARQASLLGISGNVSQQVRTSCDDDLLLPHFSFATLDLPPATLCRFDSSLLRRFVLEWWLEPRAVAEIGVL